MMPGLKGGGIVHLNFSYLFLAKSFYYAVSISYFMDCDEKVGESYRHAVDSGELVEPRGQ